MFAPRGRFPTGAFATRRKNCCILKDYWRGAIVDFILLKHAYMHLYVKYHFNVTCDDNVFVTIIAFIEIDYFSGKALFIRNLVPHQKTFFYFTSLNIYQGYYYEIGGLILRVLNLKFMLKRSLFIGGIKSYYRFHHNILGFKMHWQR